MQLQKILQNKGLTVLPDNDQWTNRFEIESETSNRVYIVAQRKNLTEWGCSCPAWRIRRKCKHLTAIMPLLQDAQRAAQTIKIS